MAVDLEKVTSQYLALLTARRSRAIHVPIAAIAVIFTLINITDRAHQQPSINVERASETEDLTDWSKFAYVQYAAANTSAMPSCYCRAYTTFKVAPTGS